MTGYAQGRLGAASSARAGEDVRGRGKAMRRPCPPRFAWTALEGGLRAADNARMYTVSMVQWKRRIQCAGISGGRRRGNERETRASDEAASV
jgi:hypothetical protein